MDFPEPAREGDLLFWRNVLAAKENHLMLQPGVVDFFEDIVVKVAEIDTADFSTQGPGDGVRLDLCVTHVLQRSNCPRGTG